MRPTACHRLAAVVAILTGLLGAPGTATATIIAPAYTVTDLGNFFATGVNDSSWVSGYDTRALVWQPGLGTQQILGPFDCAAGCTTRANAINNAGDSRRLRLGYELRQHPRHALVLIRWRGRHG